MKALPFPQHQANNHFKRKLQKADTQIIYTCATYLFQTINMIIQCFSVKSNVNLPDLLLMPCLFFSLYKKILVLLRKARFGRIRSNLKIAEKVAEFLNPSLPNSLSSSTYFWIFDVNSPLLNRLSSTCFFYLDAN